MNSVTNIINMLYIFYLEDALKAMCQSVGNVINYEYNLKDHLGNTRVVFADDNGDGSINTNEISQASDYCPFGLKHIESSYPNDASQKYLYNNKELQIETEWYDYGARMYDGQLGRFMTLDPLAESFNKQSPYLYAYNNPIIFIDLKGMCGYNPNDPFKGKQTDAAIALDQAFDEIEERKEQEQKENNYYSEKTETKIDLTYNDKNQTNTFEENSTSKKAEYISDEEVIETTKTSNAKVVLNSQGTVVSQNIILSGQKVTWKNGKQISNIPLIFSDKDYVISSALQDQIDICRAVISKGMHSTNFIKTFEKLNRISSSWQNPGTPTWVPYGLRSGRMLIDYVKINNKPFTVYQNSTYTNKLPPLSIQ